MSLICPQNIKDTQKLLKALIGIELLFGLIFLLDFLLGSPSWWIHDLFNLDVESSIPAWFSTIQLFMIGYVILVTGCHNKFQPPPSKLGTFILSFGFFFLSMDEGAEIHEKLTWMFINNPLVPYFDGRHGVWIVVYGCLAIIITIIIRKDLWALWKSYRQEAETFLAGMLLFLVGSAAMETLTFFFIDKNIQWLYISEIIVEEFLEMCGASLMLYSSLLMNIKKS